MRPLSFFILLFAFLFTNSTLSGATDRVYFGTYTKADSKGIYVSEWNSEDGTLSKPELAAETENPSFLELSSDGKFLYAVSEMGEGSVKSFRVLDNGTLELINEQPANGGATCHLSISKNGKILAAANYMGGNVASYQIKEDGSLSEPVTIIQHEGSSIDPARQKAPHAHSINFSPDNRFAYAADLGTDRIYRYSVNPDKGTLTASGETVIKPGSGPRHFTFHTSGNFAYVINEMALTIEAFSVNPKTGDLISLGTVSTLPADAPKQGSTAEVISHPSGKFLYGSNRGHDTIVVFQIDTTTGTLSYVENEPIRGEVPRNFAVSPDGEWLIAAGQSSHTASIFAIDPSSGELTYSGNQVKIDSPVCVRFVKGNE
ncbi:MAG: lactonase family protein [Verrucomicrobiales bacterium]|nr:lactonase family protein [Verrucomicrobiales bacterium]